MNVTEKELWAIINGMGWYFWGGVAALAAANLWNILRLTPARTIYGRFIRVVGLAGFTFIAMSWVNTGFGPIGLPLVLLSFLGMTHQMYVQCKVEGRVFKVKATTVGAKILTAMVEKPH